MQLSVVIITLNEERNIRRAVTSVLPVADEVVVVDSGSADGTAGICRELGCRWIVRDFDGYGIQKQFAVDEARHDWVLVLDADEEATPALLEEIRKLKALPGGPPCAGYRIPRSLFYMGRILRHGGAGGERLLRLFDRRRGRFTQVAVHEEIVSEGSTGNLQGALVHHSYANLAHHLDKLNTYSTLAAEDYRRAGRRFPKAWAAVKFPVTFFTFYILKGGFRDGYPGFVWSFLAGVYAAVKIAKTLEPTPAK